MKLINDNGIIWYELREKYWDDRIYPSMSISIIENLEFRVLSQDKPDKGEPFPIKTIRSIFTNAAKLKDYGAEEELDVDMLAKAPELRIRLESIVGMTVDRVKLCVAKPGYTVPDDANNFYKLPAGMWKYPVGTIKKLGFEPNTGEIFIQLYREENNVRQLYSFNPNSCKWEKVTGVEKLSQLYLKRNPAMAEIMQRNMPDLPAIKEVADMKLPLEMLNAKEYKQHLVLWKRLLMLLPDLLREVLALLVQYNIDLTLIKHKGKRGVSL